MSEKEVLSIVNDFYKSFYENEKFYIEIEELKKTYQISNKLSKNVRYYVSTNGNTFIKCCEDGRETSVEKGYLSTVFNRYIEKPMSEYNINYDYYINECNKIIKKIEK